MGSQLSSVIANFYMEDYEKAALESAPLKQLCWFRYVDDTTVICSHGPGKLKDFLHHLKSIHQFIQSTTETESDGHLPFLDLDIYRRPDGSVGHIAYASPHTSVCTSTPSPIITHPINKRYCLLWCIGPELTVMKTACRQSWCS
jgi:hypothetical protein